MVDTDPAKYSPLYKIKKLLLILRWFLGFPFKARNRSFDNFKFVPFLEYFRYGIYLLIYFVTHIYNGCTIMKVYGETNLILGMKKYFTDFLGFTVLDILVFWSVPYTSLISCTIYLFSFKKISSSFSDVCSVLTVINKNMCESSNLELETKKRHKFNISMKLFILEFILAMSILILYAVCFPMVLKDEIFMKSPLSLVDETIFIISVIIFTLCWVFPPITITADIVVCHMLEEMGETYLAWINLLVMHENQLPVKGELDEKTIDNSQLASNRYAQKDLNIFLNE